MPIPLTDFEERVLTGESYNFGELEDYIADTRAPEYVDQEEMREVTLASQKRLRNIKRRYRLPSKKNLKISAQGRPGVYEDLIEFVKQHIGFRWTIIYRSAEERGIRLQ